MIDANADSAKCWQMMDHTSMICVYVDSARCWQRMDHTLMIFVYLDAARCWQIVDLTRIICVYVNNARFWQMLKINLLVIKIKLGRIQQIKHRVHHLLVLPLQLQQRLLRRTNSTKNNCVISS